METSRAHISRFRSETRRTTTPHTHSVSLPDGDLHVEPSECLQDNHLLQHQSEEYLRNTQPDKKPKLPWWKTPSPWWWAHFIKFWKLPFLNTVRARLLVITQFGVIADSSTITPRIEIYTSLACSFLRPDYGESSQQPADVLGFLHSNNCSSIPAVAHQSSCVNISDVFMIDNSLQINGSDTPPTRKKRCASDPVVQAVVAKLTTRAYWILFYFIFDSDISTCTFSLSSGIRLLRNSLSFRYVGWWGFL